MQMIFRLLFSTVALGVAIAVAQTVDGEIAGRINDKSGAPLPGVRITITNGDRSREAITDRDGRFALRPLAMGTYRVVADLLGFTSTSGENQALAFEPSSLLWVAPLKWDVSKRISGSFWARVTPPRWSIPFSTSGSHLSTVPC
jgi:hypothetical protein